jgi:ZIP family zinc transporter
MTRGPMLLAALALTAVPVAAALLSGVVAALRRPGPRTTSALQHFAAGVVFAATAIELLPAVLERSPVVAIVGFAAGIVVMFSFRKLGDVITSRREARGATGFPVGLTVATGIDFLIDGVILGAGFAASSTVGVLLTIALAVEYLFVGLSLSAVLAGTVRRRTVALTPVLLALLTVAGTAIGVLALGSASPAVLAGVLAFGAVAFMYLATEELLVEAHEKGETSLGSIGFFIGFLLYLVLSELIH